MSKLNKQDLIQKLMATFLDEMDEHVASINDGLLVLEKHSAEDSEYNEAVRSLFRATHSLKGAARSVDVKVVERICHELEDVLGQLRDSGIKPPAETFHLLFAAAETLSDASEKLRRKISLDEENAQSLLDKLHRTSEQLSSGTSNHAEPFSTQQPMETFSPCAAPTAAIAFEQKLVSVPAADPMEEPEEDFRPLEKISNTEQQSLRVSADKLDSLLALSSEFLTSYRKTETWYATVDKLSENLKACQKLPGATQANTRRLREIEKEVDRFLTAMKAEVRSIGETARLVDEEIRGLRMRPLSDACLSLKLAVRELAISTNKKVELEVMAANVELDRSVLESLKDPLLHIIRNAVQHGIESPSQRRDTGKPEKSVIQLSAHLQGSQVQIEIRDDGRGIDEERVRAQARKLGLPEPQSQQDIANLLFMPAFSTSTEVNDIAGRGVGLDVVANQVTALQGSVNVTSEAGKGTCFALTVPLTLTKIRVLLVKISGQTFAFPCASVQRLLRITQADLRLVEGNQVLPFEGQLISVAGLSDALKLHNDGTTFGAGRMPVVVVSQGQTRRALIVDELVGEQEVVVTGLGSRLQRVRNLSGATLLGTGEIALILNVSELLRRNNPQSSINRVTVQADTKSTSKQKRLIVCDDSPTTRILETSILQSAGYDVTSVPDGQDAWELLQAQGADLIVSDVEMPIMDGFSLCSTIRASERWRHLPVILITGLAKESDRENGLKAGASAYVVKGEFDQTELIETIEQLI